LATALAAAAAFRVAEIVVLDRFQLPIELIHQRNPGWNIERHDVIVAHMLEMLDQRAQGIAVGGNQDALAGLYRRQNVRFPVRHETRHGVGQ